jgi:hypothetical protein
LSTAAAGEARAPRENRGAGDPLGRIVFGALVVACFLAFFLTQRLKHSPTTVPTFQLTPIFSPTPAGRHKQESISFKLSHAERVTVAVIDSRGNVVATLLRGYPVPRYKQLSLHWDGRRGTARSYRSASTPGGHRFLVPETEGSPAPAGEYRVRLTLSGQSDPVLSRRSFTLVRG